MSTDSRIGSFSNRAARRATRDTFDRFDQRVVVAFDVGDADLAAGADHSGKLGGGGGGGGLVGEGAVSRTLTSAWITALHTGQMLLV